MSMGPYTNENIPMNIIFHFCQVHSTRWQFVLYTANTHTHTHTHTLHTLKELNIWSNRIWWDKEERPTQWVQEGENLILLCWTWNLTLNTTLAQLYINIKALLQQHYHNPTHIQAIGWSICLCVMHMQELSILVDCKGALASDQNTEHTEHTDNPNVSPLMHKETLWFYNVYSESLAVAVWKCPKINTLSEKSLIWFPHIKAAVKV